jgi:DNA processing protein
MPKSSVPDLKYWLGFNKTKGIGPAKIRALIDHFGSLAEAWNANELQLQRIGIDRRTVQSFVSTREEIDLDGEMARVEAAGIDILVWDSPDYPRYLKDIPAPPPVLYVNGDLNEIDQWAVAVVGTRRFTTYGRQITQEIVSGLVRSEVTIISGLARGIDAIAHKTALEMGGRTIAVLGSGVDNIYPPENRALAAQIAKGNGAVISEYALGVKPDAKNFPPRNRVISGLSLGVVVVEAGERSGASITAGFALEQGREVFAVPGNVNSPASVGTNRLIQQGAKLVSSVSDILEELNLTMIPEQTAVQLVMPESAEEALILSHLSHQPMHIDELTQLAELSSAEISSTLTLMELKGMVYQVGGMNYVLAREPETMYEVIPEEQKADEK